jgi:TetR/AcrR family transcriptional regulator, repressor of fatR-cypB operon
MPPPVRRREPEESPKRAAILEAALDLFVERGFHGTAVPAIAERAGVGAGTIYRYFQSKEELVNVLYRIWKQEIARAIFQDLDLDQPARALFGHYWRQMTAFTRRHPKAFAFLELHHHGSYLDEESKAMEGRFIDFAAALVARMQQAGEVARGPTRVFMVLSYWSFVGVVKSAWQGLFELTDENLAAAESCAWEAIRARNP